MTTLAALLVIAGALVLMGRRVEVRLVLPAAGLLLAALAGRPLAVADAFAEGMVAAMVAPICAAMGFAAVLGATGCDRQLVGLLLSPLRRAPWAVLPGGIVAAYLVNVAVPSQAGAAAAIGPILVPLLIAAGARPEVAGAALVLGASFGGDLLNPGAQDVQALAGLADIPARDLAARVAPSSLVGLLVAASVFSFGGRGRRSTPVDDRPAPPDEPPPDPATGTTRFDPAKAAIPLVPIVLLLTAYAGWPSLTWLLRPPAGEAGRPMAGVFPVVRALLIGILLALAVGRRDAPRLVRVLFGGMGGAYGEIISLTIAARCFGAGIAAVGLGEALLGLLGDRRWALAGLAIGFPWGLAALSGSGSGPVLAFAQAVLVPLGPGPGTATLGALACLAAAFGRTMSPISAVVLYGSGLAGVAPWALVHRLLPALLAGAAAAMATAMMLGA